MIATAVIGGAVAYTSSKNQSEYQEKLADQNQKVAEAQAVDAERLGQIEAGEARLRTRLQLASQTVGFAAQNVAASGTALDILGDTAMFGEIDQQRIRANAARRAWGFRTQGYDIGAQNTLNQYAGRMDRVGTILSTVGKVAGSFGSFGGSSPAPLGGGAAPSFVGTGYGSTWGTGAGLGAAGYGPGH
jgi:hypothetical protein